MHKLKCTQERIKKIKQQLITHSPSDLESYTVERATRVEKRQHPVCPQGMVELMSKSCSQHLRKRTARVKLDKETEKKQIRERRETNQG